MSTQPRQPEDFHLVQISDCHLLARPGERLGDWDNWAALDAVLAHLHRLKPRTDAILLSGDLVNDESPAGYQRLAAQVAEFGVPVYAIPGNHDHPERMQTWMPGVQTQGIAELGHWRLALLNSHVPDSPAGHLGDDALHQLEQILAGEQAHPTLLAIHHPPAPVGSPWIDEIGLADGPALLHWAQARSHIAAIVCGHVHQASDQRHDGVRQLTCPAVTRQFLPQSDSPSEDDSRPPGYRSLTLAADGQLHTEVHRVPAARAAGLD